MICNANPYKAKWQSRIVDFAPTPDAQFNDAETEDRQTDIGLETTHKHADCK